MTAARVSISWAFTNGERSIRVTPSLSPSAFWRASIDSRSFLRGQRLSSMAESLRPSEWTLVRLPLKGRGFKRPRGQARTASMRRRYGGAWGDNAPAMATGQLIEMKDEGREAFADVLRFYELAKRREWQGRALPWAELPPIPEAKRSPQSAARGPEICRAVVQ